eukprot:Skav216896  [mRNA]  locus=scaffold1276:173329:173619:- [translate_table: standard]
MYLLGDVLSQSVWDCQELVEAEGPACCKRVETFCIVRDSLDSFLASSELLGHSLGREAFGESFPSKGTGSRNLPVAPGALLSGLPACEGPASCCGV